LLTPWNVIYKTQEEKENLLRWCIFHLPSLLLLDIKLPSFIVNFLFRELPSAILLGFVCWWQILFLSLHSNMSWSPLRSWRVFAMGIDFCVDNSFFFSLLKQCCAISFWPLRVLMRNPLSLDLFLFMGRYPSSFRTFSFFRKFHYDASEWISLSVFCLEFVHLLESVIFHF